MALHFQNAHYSRHTISHMLHYNVTCVNSYVQHIICYIYTNIHCVFGFAVCGAVAVICSAAKVVDTTAAPDISIIKP